MTLERTITEGSSGMHQRLSSWASFIYVSLLSCKRVTYHPTEALPHGECGVYLPAAFCKPFASLHNCDVLLLCDFA